MSFKRYARKGGYYPYKKSSSLKSRTVSQFKSAKKGSDSFSFVVNSNYVFAASYNDTTRSGVACIPVFDVLCRNSNFSHFKEMYDQVRLDGVKVKLNVTDAATTVNNVNSVKNTTIFTAWDKTGLSLNQLVFKSSAVGNPVISPSDYDSSVVGSFYNTIGPGISNATGIEKSILMNFQKWVNYKTLYPRTMEEKSQYISTSNLIRFAQGINNDTQEVALNGSYDNCTVNSLFSSNNVCLPFESPSYKFKPCLLVGVFQNEATETSIVPYGRCGRVLFNAEFSISVTFKDLKAYGYVKLFNFCIYYIRFCINIFKKSG